MTCCYWSREVDLATPNLYLTASWRNSPERRNLANTCWFIWLVLAFLLLSHWLTGKSTELTDPPRFKIPQLNIQAKIPYQMIAGFNEQRQSSIPLIILSICSAHKHTRPLLTAPRQVVAGTRLLQTSLVQSSQSPVISSHSLLPQSATWIPSWVCSLFRRGSFSRQSIQGVEEVYG